MNLFVLLGKAEATLETGDDPYFNEAEPPHLNWSTAMFRKRRTENGEQATEAGRDCLEVTAS